MRNFVRWLLFIVLLLGAAPMVSADQTENHGGPKDPTFIPGKTFPWDIAHKGSRLERDFTIDDSNHWYFQLEFHHNGLPQGWSEFLGGGGIDMNGKKAQPGVKVPVHLTVMRCRTDGRDADVIFDRTIETAGIDSGGSGRITRFVGGPEFSRGRYKLVAETLIDVALPPPNADAYTALGLTYRVK